MPLVNDIDWIALAPPLILIAFASVGVIAALFIHSSKFIAVFSLSGVALATLVSLQLFSEAETLVSFGGRLVVDRAVAGFGLIILTGTALAILLSYDYLRRAELDHPEYYPLMLLSATGALFMAAAADLITLLLALEIMSLAVYVLAAWRDRARESEEAGMKYFLLGAFASAFFIYGIALLYGATGNFGYQQISAAIRAPGFEQLLLASLGGLLVLAAFAFKAGMAPFHQWLPDVYTGAPTPVTAFMSVVVKTAAFAALLRLAAVLFPGPSPVFLEVFSMIIALTLVIGNLGALAQRGVKRMLAFSAVAHAGYLGLAVLAGGALSIKAVIWYLSAYTLMNIGAFAVIILISDKNDYGDDIERFAGLGKTRPFAAFALTIFLLSLAGVPLLAGFVGKVLVFQAAIGAGYIRLAVLGIATSIVAVVYYLRPVASMYFREPESEPPRVSSGATRLAIGIALAGTVFLGLLPGWWYDLLGIGEQIIAGL